MTTERRPVPTIGIITVGDELVTGRIVDRHSARISRLLTPLGYEISFHVSVGDAPGDLRRHLAFRDVDEPDAVIITGGLGPTADDRTRAEVAAACGVELEFREDQWQHIVEFMKSRGVRASAGNRHQAWFPAGSRVVANPLGTAPAFHVSRGEGAAGKRGWWVLPGVPAELEGLLAGELVPGLLEALPVATDGEAQVLRFFGVSESRLDAWFTERLTTERGYHICVSDGELEVHLPVGVDLHCDAREAFPEGLVGAGLATLAERVVSLASECGQTVSVAESCTGGRVAERLTDVPGASRVLGSAWVVYSNEAKARELGVPSALIDEHGAVSAEVAAALATGARQRAGADHAVAITGIAGPGGGSDEKPVGTVHFGLARGDVVETLHRRFHGTRDQVRSRSASCALHLLFRSLQEKP